MELKFKLKSINGVLYLYSALHWFSILDFFVTAPERRRVGMSTSTLEMRKLEGKDITSQQAQHHACPTGQPHSGYPRFSFSCLIFPEHVQIKEMGEKE